MFVLIVGGGKVGSHLARLLLEERARGTRHDAAKMLLPAAP